MYLFIYLFIFRKSTDTPKNKKRLGLRPYCNIPVVLAPDKI
jgi:hypothetical protein